MAPASEMALSPGSSSTSTYYVPSPSVLKSTTSDPAITFSTMLNGRLTMRVACQQEVSDKSRSSGALVERDLVFLKGVAAVYHNELSGDVAGFLAREKHRDMTDLVGRAGTAGRGIAAGDHLVLTT